MFLLQRLLPVDGNQDVLNMRVPDVPNTCVFTIRPFQPEDEVSLDNNTLIIY